MDPPRTTRRFQNWCPLKPMWQAGPMAAFVLLPYTLTLRHSGLRADKSEATDEVNPCEHAACLHRFATHPWISAFAEMTYLCSVFGSTKRPALGSRALRKTSALICVHRRM